LYLRGDASTTTPGAYLVNRGKWLPKWIRGFEPGAFFLANFTTKRRRAICRKREVQFQPYLADDRGRWSTPNPTFQRLDDGDYRPLAWVSGDIAMFGIRHISRPVHPKKTVRFQFNGETGRY